MSETPSGRPTGGRKGILDLIEWIGNKLPDPAVLFLIGAAVVMLASQVAVWSDWQVQPKTAVSAIDPATGEARIEFRDRGAPIKAESLLTADGLYWCLTSMVRNFMGFAPLGVVLTGMLGIGVAERTGLIGAMLKAFMKVVPKALLTPTMVFLGVMSSMGLDAGYVVLPPLAAALYKSVGRSPLAGIAAVFAGVSAGFNANLFVTGLDPVLANLSQIGANVLDPGYAVAATSNWYFAIASTFVVTLMGWAVTGLFVERRLKRKSIEDGGPAPVDASDLASQKLTPQESRALSLAAGTMGLLLVVFAAMVFIPGMPMHDRHIPVPGSEGQTWLADVKAGAKAEADFVPAPELVVEGEGYYTDASKGTFVTEKGEVLTKRNPPFQRWVNVVTPLIFIGFIIPGLVYGLAMRNIASSKDAAKVMIESIANMAPIIVLAFFAAQFIEYLKFSRLDQMIAFEGGMMLAGNDMSKEALIVAFILVTMTFNLFIGSMSAKYTMFAPIFIPMLMFVGISPELTQAAYRIGDSTTNIITPLNAYLVIVLVFVRQYAPRGGMGTLVAMMMPYTVVFTIGWVIMLLVWMQIGLPLGPGGAGPLEYTAPVAAAVAP